MIPNVLLYPFRVLFSGYFNDDQLASFLTGAFTVGILWMLTVLQECVPDKFTREWAFHRSDNEGFETDEEGDDLSFVDPWNAPLIYVSTIQKHIGELPKRFKREHWPWETIRRKVLGEESENDDEDGFSIKSDKADESILSGSISVSATTGEDTKEDSGGDSSHSHDGENNGTNSPTTTTKLDGGENEKCAKKDEKQLCIGSIFGLDVGGTLAKLVYFEKKALDLDLPSSRSLREKHYVQAVSAQTVLMANRMHNTNNVPSDRQFGDKRSTSMSPMRNFQNPHNRVRSSTSDELELEFNYDDEGVVVQNLIPPFSNKTSSMPRRRTVSVDHSRPIQTKEHQTDLPEPESLVCMQEKDEKKELQTLREHEPALNNNTNKSSAEDLKHLYAIRQGSLPDDIHQFQHSVGFLSSSSRIEERHAHEEVISSDSQKATKVTLNIVDDDDDENDDSSSKPPKTSLSTATSKSTLTQASNIPSFPNRRSLSMLDLSAQHELQKAEALNRFYDFARRLDTHEDSISDIQLSFYCRELGGEFHFISFETRKMNNAMDLIRFNNLHMNIRNMGATGGGAHKFADIWEQELAIGIIKQDELDSLVAGMQFVLSTVVGECFTFRPKEDPRTDEPLKEEKETESNASAPKIDRESNKSNIDRETNLPENDGNSKPKTTIYKLDRWTRKVQRDTISYSSAYPYMLVTIGTGVSVLRVDGPREHERVSGSTIGGGTFWGLMRLLTDVENFEHAMKLAEKGDPTKVDMMVGDIYGEDSDALDKLGLAADIVASSFGKLVSKEDPAKGLTQEDLARALLSLVTNNIGQVAYLNAKLHSTPRIYFVGSFLRHNMISQRRLAYAIDYWSKGEMEALFLEHEGYFGALGAFLMTQNIEKKDGGFFQWKNNP